MKIFIVFALLILPFFTAFSQKAVLMQPDTLTLEMHLNIKEQSDEEGLLEKPDDAKPVAHAYRVIKRSVDHKGRRLHEITIDIDRKEVKDPLLLNVRVYQAKPFFEIYQQGFVADELNQKIKKHEELTLRNGRFQINIDNVPPGQYMIEVRMIGPDRQLYILDRKITI